MIGVPSGRAASHLAHLTRNAAADALRTTRFVVGAAAFRVRADDVFLSSYPRSGTTWLQYLLHVLVHGKDTGFTHISEVAPWYERALSLGHKRARDFDALPSPRVFKSHLPYAWLPKGARYVYAQRDGRDVLVSYHQLYRSHLGDRDDLAGFFERFMAGKLQYGSWFAHVSAWRAAAARNPRVLLVSYEALRRDLSHELGRLAAFLGLSRSPEQLAAVERTCSFEAMRREEHRFDHATTPESPSAAPPGQFVRQGRVGAHRELLTPLQEERFQRAARSRQMGPRLHRLPAFLL